MKCSFCNKPINETVNAISSTNGSVICESCIERASKVMHNLATVHPQKSFELLKPSQIKAYLDEYVVGQETAKKLLSVAVYNHYKRFNYSGEVELEKSNILMTGPTGCGKTHLVKCIKRLLNVPVVIADATTLTEAGYVGKDVESLLASLLQQVDFDVERAEHGIIFIDEIDKLTRKSSHNSASRDVGGEGVQQSLLKMLEGTIVEIPRSISRNMQQIIELDTSNILFICGGSFEGISSIVEKRLHQEKRIGFTTESVQKQTDQPLDITIDDLKAFGMIPEFLGRLPIIINLHKLSEVALIQVLTKPKNSLYKQYKELFKLDNTELQIQEDALKEIALRAYKRNTGARSLRSIMEHVLSPFMYDVPDNQPKELILSKDMLKGE